MFGNTNSINSQAVATILTESYSTVSSLHEVDVMTSFDKVILDNNVFDSYIGALTESLDMKTKDFMVKSSKNIREQILLEANTFGTINPYQKMIFPLFRVFFPRLIAKEAITLGTVDSPSVVKYFIKYVLKNPDGTTVNLPHVGAPSTALPLPNDVQNLPFNADLKSLVPALSTDWQKQASIERDLKIVSFEDKAGVVASCNIQASVDGSFSGSVITSTGVTDVIMGHIDFKTGLTHIQSAYGEVAGVSFAGRVSTEMNTNNRTVEMTTEKINIETKERELQANWTINFEQDAKALLDINLKSEMIAILGAQIATEIDQEIIHDIVAIAETQHPSAVQTFSKTPPSTFAFGPKNWHENVIPVINLISNTIYNDTNIGQGNVIMMNPLDATVLQSLGNYTSTNLSEDGELTGGAYEVGNIQNKWKVLVSPLVPLGKAPILMKSSNEKEAVYCLYYYQPLYVSPFPLQSVPSITLKSRYSKTLIRKEGIGLLKLV